MNGTRAKLTELKSRLTQILEARGEACRVQETTLQDLELAFKKSSAQLKTEIDTGLQTLNAKSQQETKFVTERWKRRTTKVEAAYSRLKGKIDAQSRTQIAALNKKQTDAHNQANQAYEETVLGLRKQNTDGMAVLAEIQDAATKLKLQISAFADEHGLQLDPKLSVVNSAALPPDADTHPTTINERYKKAEQQFTLAYRKLKRRMSAFAAYSLILLVHAAAGFAVFSLYPGTPYVFGVGVSLIVIIALVQGIHMARSNKAYVAAADVIVQVADVCGLIEREKQVLEESLTQAVLNAEGEKIQRIVLIDEQVAVQTRESRKATAEQTKKLSVHRDRLIKKIAADKELGLARCKAELEKNTAVQNAKSNKKDAAANAQYETKKKQTEDAHVSAIARLTSEWSQALGSFQAFHAETTAACRKLNPPWSALTAQTLRLPAAFPSEVYCGDVTVDLKKLMPDSDPEGPFSIPEKSEIAMPLTLSFPNQGSMFIRCGVRNREDAGRFLFGTVLRLLCSLPPNKAKLTIIDPIGLGQNFSALMHLADYDESLVGGKIWSDVPHIEKELTELTEHIEKIIQKYLRNRYETIDDFNREAGTMSEPYRFLVIADFPSGFNEAATERLASIISSGAKCGVYTIILHDDKQKLPPSIVPTQIRRNGLYIDERDNGKFFVDDAALLNGTLVPEEPPTSAPVDGLVNALGKQCQEAARVQVPFESAAPKESEYWTSIADSGIRLPLGKAGADRLQYMHLGKATAQHALIAGKTGSGKSNLFHVIITNAALWYSPKELEFYLIDFKKGVEFKTYGVHHLPHARVIAIESDREFGLSVLRKLDRELSHRGELFRRARVQDYPSYRKVPGVALLPRTMLIIDEFQEYFVDDDSVSQDAALLLDRIIRQGRAFGIHVVLGSQTLGGSYSLPKSTLGQVAVRIALQCNESDSHLILGDDNSAAALLSRPGEAIYNDMSGLVEGNNPFQAVYIEKESQDAYLKVVEDKMTATHYVPDEQAIIFEGNKLSELRDNGMLTMAASRTPLPGEIPTPRLWLGEANAIKGPTEVQFTRQAGNNLLIVGQRGDGELAMCCSTVMSLCSENAPDKLRIIIFDGSSPESGTRERLHKLISPLPHKIEIVDHRKVAPIIEELAATVKTRQEDGTADTRIFLLVLGLDRFRMLRDEEEFSFGSSEEGAAVPPAKGFISVVTDGPGAGIHTVVWCDTLGNLKRTLANKTLKEFEMRVLFQMSANDSSELIDSPSANRLGMYNALLYTAQSGAIEKFRPYTAPDDAFVREIATVLKQRNAAHKDDAGSARIA